MQYKVKWIYWLLASALCAIWTLYAGKDVNWDFFHYHVYAAENALSARVLQDHLAAGPQSLTNPYAFLLLGGLLRWNPPAWIFGFVISLVQSTSLWVVWSIAEEVIPKLRESNNLNRLLLAALLLAGVNPLLLSQLGTTFTDLLTAIPVLIGVWLTLRGLREDTPKKWTVAGGVFLGVSIGLKLSNVLLVIPFWLSYLIFVRSNIFEKFRDALMLGVSIILGYFIVSGPWAWQVWGLTGNPFYPFLTGWIDSPDLPIGAERHIRFTSENLQSALILPWRMALPLKGIYVEGSLPDVRYILLALTLAVWCIYYIAGKAFKSIDLAGDGKEYCARRVITLAALGQYFLWVWLSGNGRYIVSLSLLVGVLLVAWYPRMHILPKKIGFVLLVSTLGIQVMQFTFGAGLRWSSVPWANHWMEVEVPDELTSRPYLYVGLELQSESWLASFVHRQSAFTLPVGQQAFALKGRGGKRLQDLYRSFGENILVLTHVSPAVNKTEVHDAFRQELNNRIARLGLYSPPDFACFNIRRHDSLPLDFRIPSEKIGKQIYESRGPDIGLAARKATGFSLPDRSDETREIAYYLADSLIADPYLHWVNIYACPARVDMAAYENHARQVFRIDQALTLIENKCKMLFTPQPSVTERDGPDSWSRFYVATDMRLISDRGSLMYQDSYRQGAMIEIGSVDGWIEGRDRQLLDCKKRYQAPKPLNLEVSENEIRNEVIRN